MLNRVKNEDRVEYLSLSDEPSLVLQLCSNNVARVQIETETSLMFMLNFEDVNMKLQFPAKLCM